MTVRYEDNSAAFLAKVTAAANVGVGRAAEFVAQEIRKGLNQTTGSVVAGTGGDTGKRAQYLASTPGTPPGTRSGRLRNSITTQKRGDLRYAVGTNVKYARIHELGGVIKHPGGTHYLVTKDGIRFVSEEKGLRLRLEGKHLGITRAHNIPMPPRPYLRPGLERAQASGGLHREFNRGFKAAFKAGAA